MSAVAEGVIVKKVIWRIMPIAMLLFFFSLLDRTNISFAALDMNKDLGLSPAKYGTAAGIFFIGYVLFEIPSNIVLARVGARIWLARIMITWGLIVMAMATVRGETSLYVLRFLLGVAEAGLLPGLLLYLGQWLPARERGLAYAALLTTTAVAYAVGAPLTTSLMRLSLFGLNGWQTMFFIQGALTIVAGVLAFVLLPSRIAAATWLSEDERSALSATLAREEENKKLVGATTIRGGFLDPRVLLSTLTCFFLVCANFGTVLWLPQIVKGAFPALTNIQISLLISVAFLIGGISGICAGRSSDRSNDRKWHLVVGALVASVGYAYAGLAPGPSLQFVGVCVGVLGIWSMFGIFWAYNGDLLGGPAAAGGLAMINSVGSIGGVVAPVVLAAALDKSGSFGGSLLALAGFSLVTAALAACLKPVARAPRRAALALAE